MSEAEPIAARVWKTLSAVDVSKHVEQKGGLSYLSWAWAWGTLMQHFPEARYEILPDDHDEETGTVTVWVEVTIDELSRRMWLPVMDHRNNSVQHPTSRQVSDARMRCLVKCLAMLGLGHHIYAGEDLPMNAPVYTEEQKQAFHELAQGDDPLAFLDFLMGLTDEQKIELHNSGDKGEKVRLKEAARAQEQKAHEALDAYEASILQLAETEDIAAVQMMQEVKDTGRHVFKALWDRIPEGTRQFLIEHKEAA